MRKLILALTALACLCGAALAQQSPTTTANQGAAGSASWPVKVDQATPGTSNGVVANVATNPTGGIPAIARVPVTAAGSNILNLNGGPGRLYQFTACNTSTTPVRVRFYNALNPTPGTTAVLLSRAIPAAAASGGLACASWDAGAIGWAYTTALSVAFSAGTADDASTTGLTAGQVTDVSIEYR